MVYIFNIYDNSSGPLLPERDGYIKCRKYIVEVYFESTIAQGYRYQIYQVGVFYINGYHKLYEGYESILEVQYLTI